MPTSEHLDDEFDVSREPLNLVEVCDGRYGNVLIGVHLRNEVCIIGQVLPKQLNRNENQE